jgi:hypothetical protein
VVQHCVRLGLRVPAASLRRVLRCGAVGLGDASRDLGLPLWALRCIRFLQVARLVYACPVFMCSRCVLHCAAAGMLGGIEAGLWGVMGIHGMSRIDTSMRILRMHFFGLWGIAVAGTLAIEAGVHTSCSWVLVSAGTCCNCCSVSMG